MTSRARILCSAGAFAIAFGFCASAAQAALVVTSVVGGAPTGVNYVNFDNLPLGSAGGTSDGVGVSFKPDGAAVTGASNGLYAAPFLSNGNGVLFGDPSNGADTTTYLSTGVGSATLTLPGMEHYLGLLWGSVDSYNTLQFYSGSTLVGTLTGNDVTATANGNQGVNGTYYVNIDSDMGFNTVVASSSSYAFELDNVAYNTTAPVPEPASLAILGLGTLGVGAMRRRKKSKQVVA